MGPARPKTSIWSLDVDPSHAWPFSNSSPCRISMVTSSSRSTPGRRPIRRRRKPICWRHSRSRASTWTAEMTEPTDTAFLDNAARLAPTADPERLGAGQTKRLMDVFDSQLGSRHLDLAARWLRAQGKGFYTIGSAGHEGNAAVAASLRPTDPALLHYRSGAFYVERARQVPGQHPLRDVMLGVAAATDEPMSGGRHKVFGNRELNVIPQTSTIASHLPRALGVAFAIDRARKLGLECAWPADSIVVCSFGDASANHSTAQGAFNACLLYTSDAADDLTRVDLGGRRIIKKKKKQQT